jgi:hypothetical protein
MHHMYVCCSFHYAKEEHSSMCRFLRWCVLGMALVLPGSPAMAQGASDRSPEAVSLAREVTNKMTGDPASFSGVSAYPWPAC